MISNNTTKDQIIDRWTDHSNNININKVKVHEIQNCGKVVKKCEMSDHNSIDARIVSKRIDLLLQNEEIIVR